MIIENEINREKAKESIKLFLRYATLERKKKFTTCIIIGLCCGIILMLSWWILHKKIYLSFGIVMVIYNLFLIIKFNITQHKMYTKTLLEELTKYSNYDSVSRRHIFENRLLTLELDYGGKKIEQKYSFDTYYKLWIEDNSNVIIVQFGKKPNGKIVIIYYDQLSNFKQYCQNNNIEYLIVKK